MRGQILAYVADKEMGLIATAEGQRLSFRAADWLEVIAPERGMAVECVALDAHRAGQVQLALPEPVALRPKRKPVITLLTMFLGAFGAHRFYMGAWGWGLLQLLGLPVVLAVLFALLPPLAALLYLAAVVFIVVEMVRYVWMSDAEFDAKVRAYQATRPGPFSFFW